MLKADNQTIATFSASSWMQHTTGCQGETCSVVAAFLPKPDLHQCPVDGIIGCRSRAILSVLEPDGNCAGGIIGVHGDDMGLRLPPLMSPIQVVVVPILRKNCDAEAIRAAAQGLVSAAASAGIRAKLDDDETKSPGFRFNHWEQKVPCMQRSCSAHNSLPSFVAVCSWDCVLRPVDMRVTKDLASLYRH